PNSPGAGTLKDILLGDFRLTLSDTEDRFQALMAAHDLPLPQTNRNVTGRTYVDCRWPEHRLTVELDSYTYHATRHAWGTSHNRAREAYARGDDFRSYTRDDVVRTPSVVAKEVRDALRRSTTIRT